MRNLNVIGLGRPAILLAGLATSALATNSLVQGVPANAADDGEIIVTAQRVEQNLQDVPVSVSAFGSEQLKNGNIETVQDIALRTPGLSVGALDPVISNFAIRGIGSAAGISQNAAGDPSVVVFVDGVYAGRGGTPDIDALDLERVEVLRGPQGTLFGKNAIGGLVQFISKKPSQDASLRLTGTIGNYDRIDVNAHGNVPLSDTIYLAAGFSSKNRDGFEFNETTGNRVNDQKLTTARLALRFVPNDDLDIILRGDIAHQDQKGNPRHNNCDATFQGGIHCVGINPDPRVVNAYIDGYIKRDIRTLSAEINWDVPIGTLTSLTAVRKVDYDFTTVFFSNPINPPAQIESTDIGEEDNTQLSEELRLAFDGFDDRLKGQVGLYYLKEKNNRTERLIQDFPAPSITGRISYPQAVRATSFAIFGQVDFAITPALIATVGARMTWEEKKGRFAGFKTGGPGQPPPLASNFDVTTEENWKAFTPRFALNWHATDDVLLYASVARGYKSGGFQGIAANATSAATPYDPEFAWGYEIGAKTEWFDRRLRLNAALFKTDYTNLQVSFLVPLVGVVISNAATADIKGAEFEFVAKPIRGLQIDGSYAHLDAKFTEYVTPQANFTGNQVPRSPKHKVNIGAQYKFWIGDWSIQPRVDYSWISDAYFEASNIPTQLWPSHENLDARLTLSGPDDQWELAVWGKNLTNELVPTYVTAFAPFRQVLTPYAPPRTYGVSLSFKM